MSDLQTFSANPSDSEFYQNPYRYYAQMHGLGKLFYWKEYDLICVANYELVSDLLRDRRFGREITHIMSRQEAGLNEPLANMPIYNALEAASMLEREPPVHTRLRSLVNRAFVSRHIDQLEPDIRRLCHELIDGFSNGRVELLKQYAEIIPVYVIAEFLGVPTEMSNQLLDWSHKMVAMYQFDRNSDTEIAAEKASKEFYDFIVEIANERRANPKDDLISKLVEVSSKQEKLSQDELVSTCILLLNAGHEATVHAIGNSVHALLCYPEKLQSIIDGSAIRSEGTIEELLRIDPPLHLFRRFALQDIEIEGCQIKKAQEIGLLLGAANHDPIKYSNPDRLDFERGGVGQLGFGAGIHFCLGKPLARLEMGIALEVLFSRLPNLRLAGQPQKANRFHFNGLVELYCEY